MSGYRRMKRVTDPLDDKAKARIIGNNADRILDHYYISSSGSEHSSDHHHATSSDTLSDLFFNFQIDHDTTTTIQAASPDNMESNDSKDSEPNECDIGKNVDTINRILHKQHKDDFIKTLKTHVTNALQMFSNSSSNCNMQRNVMSYLRNRGYNAAVCKSKWPSSSGITAGSYNYIDIIRYSENIDSSTSSRYLIDLDFKSEFEIARPTSGYERLVDCLPTVFIGTVEDMKRVLKVLSDGAKRSLKSKGLHMPPWRKHRFMVNKWLGPHRRTVNVITAAEVEEVRKSYNASVTCRAVGFDAGMFAAMARTR